MPRVQYSRPQLKINVTKAMPAPKNYSDINAWFRQACKIIPDIPAKWFRPEPILTRETIIFELIEPKTHDRCAVVIDRKPT